MKKTKFHERQEVNKITNAIYDVQQWATLKTTEYVTTN